MELPVPLLHLIPFPSDSLSLGMLRRYHADEMDVETDTSFNNHRWVDAVQDVVYYERILAEASFLDVLNAEDGRRNEDDRDAARQRLVEIYTNYGLVDGEHTARLKIANFENLACQQGLQFGNRHRR